MFFKPLIQDFIKIYEKVKKVIQDRKVVTGTVNTIPQLIKEKNKMKNELEKLKLKNNEDIITVEERIEDLKIIVEALKIYQHLVAFYGNDVKNVIEYLKLDA